MGVSERSGVKAAVVELKSNRRTEESSEPVARRLWLSQTDRPGVDLLDAGMASQCAKGRLKASSAEG